MQREIASVMAACAMRGIRYIAFPPVVFETPAPLAAPETPPAAEAGIAASPPPESPPAPAIAAPSSPEPAAPGMAAPVVAAQAATPSAVPSPAAPPPAAPPSAAPPEVEAFQPAPMPPPAAMPAPEPAAGPHPAMRRLVEFATETQAPPARLRRLTELSAAESLEPPDEAGPPRRYALLNDIAVELRPRRTRARAGKRAWP
ncbi:hypothetical protein [Sediminicoccus sp. KRV36]|uniref:hypothetical protein n=1 Tax=Sediminicoccus sp. KRV36 TaxID=3133721 RepID=UPI002010632C|nr:hypothetical protein [Sediminicoccus rosea]UPY37748.1 hypothetical protein LHU95_03375 [Sediminicoccus rosea]